MAAVNFPSNPNNNDTFEANGITYVYNSTKDIWVVSTSTSVTAVVENYHLNAGNIIPAANITQSLGNVTHRWKDLYLSGDTLVLGDVAVKAANGTLATATVEGNGYIIPAETAVGSGGGASRSAAFTMSVLFGG